MDTLEQLQIQTYYYEHRLIPEQKPHEYNPCFNYCTTPMHILATREAGPRLATFPDAYTTHAYLTSLQLYRDAGKFVPTLNGVRSQWQILTQLCKCSPNVTKLFSLKMTQRSWNM
jgi:hypothetical protein